MPVPIVNPAPGWFSTTTACPQRLARRSASWRVTMSWKVPAPPVTMRTGFTGQVCALAAAATPPATSKAQRRRSDAFMAASIKGLEDLDARDAGERLLAGPLRRIPQRRAGDALGTMEERLAHGDDERQRGQLAFDRHARAQPLVAHDDRGAVDAQRLALARNEEQEPYLRALHDVAQGVRAAVARAVRDGERALVEHGDEAGRVAFGRDVHVPGCVCRGDEGEAALGEEGAAGSVERRALLREHTRARRAERLAHACLARHHIAELESHATHVDSAGAVTQSSGFPRDMNFGYRSSGHPWSCATSSTSPSSPSTATSAALRKRSG